MPKSHIRLSYRRGMPVIARTKRYTFAVTSGGALITVHSSRDKAQATFRCQAVFQPKHAFPSPPHTPKRVLIPSIDIRQKVRISLSRCAPITTMDGRLAYDSKTVARLRRALIHAIRVACPPANPPEAWHGLTIFAIGLVRPC